MKYLHNLSRPFLPLNLTLPFYITGCNSENTSEVISITTTDTDGSTSVDETVLTDVLNTLPLDDLSNAESDALEGNEDIALVYVSLMKGSRNHLRAFVSNLEAQGEIYQPQYLSQDDYDAIINADFEAD